MGGWMVGRMDLGRGGSLIESISDDRRVVG